MLHEVVEVGFAKPGRKPVGGAEGRNQALLPDHPVVDGRRLARPSPKHRQQGAAHVGLQFTLGHAGLLEMNLIEAFAQDLAVDVERSRAPRRRKGAESPMTPLTRSGLQSALAAPGCSRN